MKESEKELIAHHASAGDRSDRVIGVVFFLCSGLYCLLKAAAYLPPFGELPAQLEVIDSIMPVSWWAWAWVGAAGLMFAGAFSRLMQKIAVPLFAAMIAMLAASFLVENLNAGTGQPWNTAGNYAYMWLTMLTATYFITRRGERGEGSGDGS